MKKFIHVNQHVIRSNKKNGNVEHPISVKTYKGNTYSSCVKILDKDSNVVAIVKYSPNKPLDCGTHVWIETENEVQIDD